MSPLAREKEGEKEMIKERRKTARGEAEREKEMEGGGGMEGGREERASVSTPCVKRADGNGG